MVRPKGQRLHSLLILSFSLPLALLLAEGLCRLLWTPTIWHDYYRADPILHHRGKAQIQSFQILPDGTRIEIHTNSLGLRDKEIPAEKGDEVRILILGDSFTEAGTSPLDKTAATILEQKLNRENVTPAHVRVINAGQVSYSPILEYLFLKETLLDLKPDIVLLNLDMTDVQDDYIYSSIAEYDDQGLPLAVPKRDSKIWVKAKYKPSKLFTWLHEHFYAVQLFEHLSHFEWNKRAANIIPGRLANDRLGTTRDGVNYTQDYMRTFSHILNMRALLQEKGIPFLVFVYPHGHQSAGREWQRGREAYAFEQDKVYTGTFFPFLAKACQQYRVHCYLLLEEFRSYNGAELLFLPFNGHFSAAGEALLAQAHFEAIVGGKYLRNHKSVP
ncbi:MAG: SGNH/GDSL hydrolase family protein [Myxococcota bacterium]|jgi:hypothetical protein|nr:SGNH/GDSL hydrolase family protein [Myxococcota bacterium]